MCHYNIDRWLQEGNLTIEPSVEPSGPGVPGTDWRIPINRRYYATAHFPLPPNTIPREPLPVPGPPHASRLNAPLRPLNWRRGRYLQLVPTAPALEPTTTPMNPLERLNTPGHFLRSIDTIMSDSPPATATAELQPPPTTRANSWSPPDIPPIDANFTLIISAPADDAKSSSSSSPHPGSYVSGMSIAPLTPLPTPGLSRRDALPLPGIVMPDTPPPRHDSPDFVSGSDSGTESSVGWDDEGFHGIAVHDDGDIARARNPPVEELDVSPRTVSCPLMGGSDRMRYADRGRVSRFVEHLDVSAPMGFFE